MSQSDLARKLGVSFQQIQKYEKGTNRVGTGGSSDAKISISRRRAVRCQCTHRPERDGAVPIKLIQTEKAQTAPIPGHRASRNRESLVDLVDTIAGMPNGNSERRRAANAPRPPHACFTSLRRNGRRRLLWPWPRSGRSHRPRHRRSASSRRAAPCSRAPARAARCRPTCPAAGLPFSFSILRTVSRNSRSSPAVEPTTWLAMIEEEAWPSAQAFTSWAKSVTTARPS